MLQIEDKWTEVTSWILAALAAVLLLKLGLLSALIAGSLIYFLTHSFADRIPNLANDTAKTIVVATIATVVIAAIAFFIIALVTFVRAKTGGIPALLAKMADILTQSRASLPASLSDYLPTDVDSLSHTISEYLRTHASDIKTLGKHMGHVIVTTLIGMIVGGMLALQSPSSPTGRLQIHLQKRIAFYGAAFRDVVFAQARIAAINTVFTALYLLVVLPLAGIHLPFAPLLVLITFLVGLLPVVGNLISNTIIVVLSLGQSLQLALFSLAFLALMHKAEYFLNAKIIGKHTQTKPWELLISMMVMESAFGMPGVVAAPIFYAWLKRELRNQGLIGNPSLAEPEASN
jgi:predicted PurR-regulated permease PerM